MNLLGIHAHAFNFVKTECFVGFIRIFFTFTTHNLQGFVKIITLLLPVAVIVGTFKIHIGSITFEKMANGDYRAE